VTVAGLMAAVASGIEALTTAPLSTFEAYVTTPISTREISDGAVFIDIADEGVAEVAQGMMCGSGRWELTVPLEITATWRAANNATDVAKAFSVLEQLAQFVRDNRSMTVDSEQTRYASWRSGTIGYHDEGRDDDARMLRAVRVVATWTIPASTT
jgi:hypothetical protein